MHNYCKFDVNWAISYGGTYPSMFKSSIWREYLIFLSLCNGAILLVVSDVPADSELSTVTSSHLEIWRCM